MSQPDDHSEGGRTGPGRRGRWLVAVGAVTALLVCCCGGTASSFFLGGLGEPPKTFGFGCGEEGGLVDLKDSVPTVGDYGEVQMRNAATIIQIGQRLGVPPRGWVIAVATAMQESRLRNLPHLGDQNDHDSLGLFQQRPSSGWGRPEEILNPEYAARKFYEKLVTVRGWAWLPLTDAAQKVQISAYPDAYAKHEPIATQIVNLLTNGAARAAGTATEVRCVATGELSASGWTVPLKASVSSGFRTSSRPDHYGVDFSVDRGTEIHATAAGIVATVLCNASNGNCDVDGGVDVKGCGWYVDIRHAGGVLTRYCHLVRRPTVSVGQRIAPGQVIGGVGSSGNSSGPHLHFEIHTGGGTGNSSAVDPMKFMREIGAPLGESR